MGRFFPHAAMAVALVFTPTSADAQEWITVHEWSSSGTMTTPDFRVSVRDWRIVWSTQNEVLPGAGIFQIYVHDDSDNLIALAANKQGTGSGTSYVKPTGRFYLDINSGNVDWTVKVQVPQK